jgi:hypothetical protein
LVDSLAACSACWFIGLLVHRLAVLLVGSMGGCFVGLLVRYLFVRWFIRWLVHWLIDWFVR